MSIVPREDLLTESLDVEYLEGIPIPNPPDNRRVLLLEYREQLEGEAQVVHPRGSYQLPILSLLTVIGGTPYYGPSSYCSHRSTMKRSLLLRQPVVRPVV